MHIYLISFNHCACKSGFKSWGPLRACCCVLGRMCFSSADSALCFTTLEPCPPALARSSHDALAALFLFGFVALPNISMCLI